MKNFFTLVFGGLAMVGSGIAISYGGAKVWYALQDFSPGISLQRTGAILAAAASAIMPQPGDGTSIYGIKRTIRYTADEEEDLINNAAQSLPLSSDGQVTANAYIIKDISANRIVAGNNSETLAPIASLTKLVSAVVSRKVFQPDRHITITGEIMNTFGNTGQFSAGEVFRAEDLYYPLLMVSSNDAAEAFAHEYGRKQFLQAMNDFAQSIGAYRTYFADASGLSPLNESTANDMAIILDWIHTNDPGILAITTLKSKTVHDHTWVNPTHFLNWSNYIGGKNGYTPEANRTGASIFTLGVNKDLYAVVVLGSASRDADVVTLLSKVK